MKFSARTLSASSLALLSLAVLAGCGSNDDAASSESSSAAASTSAATESVEATVEPVIPEGYKVVTASKNGITFAIPESWMELNSSKVAEMDEAIQAMSELANGQFDAETLKQQVAALDLMAISTEMSDATGPDSVTVESKPVPAASLPAKEELTPVIAQFGVTPTDYSTIETPLGEAALISYHMDANGVHVEGAYLVVPAGGGDGYTMIAVTTSDAASTKKLAEEIAASVAAA